LSAPAFCRAAVSRLPGSRTGSPRAQPHVAEHPTPSRTVTPRICGDACGSPRAWPARTLDAESEARLLDRHAAASSFARASGSITVIVSHRMSTVRMADVIAVVEHGRITEVGTHADLLARNGLYGELYATQAAAYR
jgi:hypothetical protein